MKEPVPGRVKTRLAASIGAEAAAAAFRTLVETVCQRLPPEPDRVVVYDPPGAEKAMRDWLTPLLGKDALFWPQSAGDLGARLSTAFDQAFARGYSKVIAIGSDCVELDAHLLTDAFGRLDNSNCVLGPSADGGYYLIGLRTPCATLFEEIEWSSKDTLRQTLGRVYDQGLSVSMLPVLSDVDTLEDWERAKRSP